MTPTHEQLNTMKPKIEEIGRRFGVSQIRVFGSVARGTATEKSDIDLLVHVEPRRSLLDIIGFEQEVAELLGVKVDVVTERALHHLLEDSIRRDARSL
jgi:predicted nucleotidyltransferase